MDRLPSLIMAGPVIEASIWSYISEVGLQILERKQQ